MWIYLKTRLKIQDPNIKISLKKDKIINSIKQKEIMNIEADIKDTENNTEKQNKSWTLKKIKKTVKPDQNKRECKQY